MLVRTTFPFSHTSLFFSIFMRLTRFVHINVIIIIIFPFQIQPQIRKAQSGLGACGTMSVDDASLTRSKSQKNWEKARERFADSCQVDAPSPKAQCVSPKAWVKAEPEVADSHADVDPETQG